MNLFEFENQQFPGTWTEETRKEVRKSKPPERKERTEEEMFPDVDRTDPNWEDTPDEYYCWYGRRIPCWFE